jgi:hypothetical protein
MDRELSYLLSFLEDEFRDFPEVRVRVAPKAGTQRSPDLPQDYDAESNDLHLRRGVFVKTRRKEFYFPLDWWHDRKHSHIHRQTEEILEYLRGGAD